MTLTAKDLNGNHIGKTVTINHEGAQISGLLSSIEFTADLITDQRLGETTPTLHAGRITYMIALGYKVIRVEKDTPITIQEEQ